MNICIKDNIYLKSDGKGYTIAKLTGTDNKGKDLF